MRQIMTQAEAIAAELASRIRAGDERAEEELFERYRRGIALILNESLGSRAEAEDLFQETFRLSLEKIRRGELQDPRRLPQFLSSLARNLAIDYFRKKTRRRTDDGLGDVEAELEIQPSQYDRVARKEKAALALRVLRELRNNRYRELLYRFYIAEEEKEAICSDLGLSSLHFNRVLFRARQSYRELYLEAAAKGARD